MINLNFLETQIVELLMEGDKGYLESVKGRYTFTEKTNFRRKTVVYTCCIEAENVKLINVTVKKNVVQSIEIVGYEEDSFSVDLDEDNRDNTISSIFCRNIEDIDNTYLNRDIDNTCSSRDVNDTCLANNIDEEIEFYERMCQDSDLMLDILNASCEEFDEDEDVELEEMVRQNFLRHLILMNVQEILSKDKYYLDDIEAYFDMFVDDMSFEEFYLSETNDIQTDNIVYKCLLKSEYNHSNEVIDDKYNFTSIVDKISEIGKSAQDICYSELLEMLEYNNNFIEYVEHFRRFAKIDNIDEYYKNNKNYCENSMLRALARGYNRMYDNIITA